MTVLQMRLARLARRLLVLVLLSVVMVEIVLTMQLLLSMYLTPNHAVFGDALAGPQHHQESPGSPQPITTITPHDILREISLGIDLFSTPFVTSSTEGGFALDFTFPVSAALSRGSHTTEKGLTVREMSAPTSVTSGQTPNKVDDAVDSKSIPDDATHGGIDQERRLLPLANDLHHPEHATSLLPLSKNCTCYTCQRHHRAYIHHLLVTDEMLGWVLLQVHNFHVFDAFFAGIRKCIEQGGDVFERERQEFEKRYDNELPGRTGKGPRLLFLFFVSDLTRSLVWIYLRIKQFPFSTCLLLRSISYTHPS